MLEFHDGDRPNLKKLKAIMEANNICYILTKNLNKVTKEVIEKTTEL